MDRANRVAAVIVAGGEGVRMGAAQKKQYAMLGNLPVLAHTLSAFENCDAIEAIFLVIPEGDHAFCEARIVSPLKPRKKVLLVSGGPTRQDSVFNGLKATQGEFDMVAIHDGVRPLVKGRQIRECVTVAQQYGACIPAIEATETVKTVDEENRVVSTMKRHTIRMAQTPQIFYYNLILGAHVSAQEQHYEGTDDAELVELQGRVVKVIPGDPRNIKITTPEDLKIAQTFLDADK